MASQLVYTLNCTTNNVTTSAYTTIVLSTPVPSGAFQFVYFDPAGGNGALATLAIGAAGFEQDVILSSVYSAVSVPIFIPAGTRLSVKAIGASITAGFLSLSLAQ